MSAPSIFTLIDWNPTNTLYEEISIPPDPKDRRNLLKKLRKSSQMRFSNLEIRLSEMCTTLTQSPAPTKRDGYLNDMMLERIVFFNSYPTLRDLRRKAVPAIPISDSCLTQAKFVRLVEDMTRAHSILGMAENCMNEVEEVLNRSRRLPT